MKKILFLSFIMLVSVSLAGCGSKVSTSTEGGGMMADNVLNEELTHHAYDTIFVLTLATLNAPDEEHGVSLKEDAETSVFTLTDTPYLPYDAPDAVASGTMKAIKGETSDRSEVDLSFENDPKGLKTIKIESSGLHGERHNEGTFLVNGQEVPFMEFIEYFANKANTPPSTLTDNADEE